MIDDETIERLKKRLNEKENACAIMEQDRLNKLATYNELAASIVECIKIIAPYAKHVETRSFMESVHVLIAVPSLVFDREDRYYICIDECAAIYLFPSSGDKVDLDLVWSADRDLPTVAEVVDRMIGFIAESRHTACPLDYDRSGWMEEQQPSGFIFKHHN